MAEVIEIRSEDIKKIKNLKEGKTIPLKTNTGKIVYVDAEKLGKAIDEAYERKKDRYDKNPIYIKYGRYTIAIYDLPSVIQELKNAIKEILEYTGPIVVIILAIKSPEIIDEIGKIYINKLKLKTK